MHTKQTPPKPPISEILFGQTKETWLKFLKDFYPSWRWHIGNRRFGDSHFRPEYPDAEIVSFWQPMHGKRDQKFAVYAEWRGE